MAFNYMNVNLAESSVLSTYLSVLTASIVIELLLLINYRAFPNYWGNVINNMYTEFTLTIVVIDILALLITFGFTQLLYEYLFGLDYWNIAVFMVVMVFYQVFRNIFYFYIVPFFMSFGTNKLYDNLSGSEVSNIKNMIIGIIFIALIFPIITAIFTKVPINFQLEIIIFGLFLICYMLLNYPPNKGTGIELANIFTGRDLEVEGENVQKK